ncbi:MAG: LLM class flavin-dependent oxidoreductase [Mesorhizobium sp.]|uniref:LLM class flavin-dependent oxidoreductase n=1 Tax=Mesorhizobium sp. TaxID=1871066 RepID=UPI000FE93E55|nr:LLM class flavin-dependent oxidoreductase [Mesorhizobium sp.]RWK46508.1 MAG: LLM class flavin-dependent oxidoreductase [Mesorhizobium sp.]
MSIEFTFVPGTNSNGRSAAGAAPFFFDPHASAVALARVEDAGFQSVVIDNSGGSAGLLTNFDLAANAAALTSSLQIVLTHWAGVVAPTVAARQLASLAAASEGRLALRILPDGIAEDDLATDSHPSHIATWQRTDEYLTLLKRLWSNDKPFDHEGPFYSVRGGFVPNKDPRGFAIPIRMSGLSGTSLKVAGRHADIFELASGAPEDVRVLIARVRGAAAQYGRSGKIRFAMPVSFMRERPLSRSDAVHVPGPPPRSALSLIAYADAGVSEFMVTGPYDPEKIERFGQAIAPLLRNSLARKERRAISPAPGQSGTSTMGRRLRA